MITNNYKNALSAWLNYGAAETKITTPTGSTKTITACYTGSAQEMIPIYMAGSCSMQLTETTYTDNNIYGMWFGNGTEAPTADDYRLSGAHVVDFNQTRFIEHGSDENGDYGQVTYTITATADITISELGLFCRYWYGSGKAYAILTDHILLDTPLTLASGEVGQVVYRFYNTVSA